MTTVPRTTTVVKRAGARRRREPDGFRCDHAEYERVGEPELLHETRQVKQAMRCTLCGEVWVTYDWPRYYRLMGLPIPGAEVAA